MATSTQALSDNHIHEAVLRELKREEEISSSDISVTVQDGVVRLMGFVHSNPEKSTAETAAKRVHGVKAVANDIEVKPGRERTDREIARDVGRVLRTHISVPDEKIKVTVRDGRVTLEGTVNWHVQKLAATAAVRTVAGIAAVCNNIVVEPPGGAKL